MKYGGASILDTNQSRVTAWVREVFTNKEAEDVQERALRMAEEALELAQACEVDAATLHRLVDYVFSRPVGVPESEIAGTMVTVYALAAALGVDAQMMFENELVRIQTPEVIERCRRRQHEKREVLAAPLDDAITAVLEAELNTVTPAFKPIQVPARDGGGTWFELRKDETQKVTPFELPKKTLPRER